jgi:hypothetical protein
MEKHQTKAHKFFRPAIRLYKLLNRLDAEWANKLDAAEAEAPSDVEDPPSNAEDAMSGGGGGEEGVGWA